jgi:hypothetical protein
MQNINRNQVSRALGNFFTVEIDFFDIMVCTHKVLYRGSIQDTCGKSSLRARRTTFRCCATVRAHARLTRGSVQANVPQTETARRRPRQPQSPCHPSKNAEAGYRCSHSRPLSLPKLMSWRSNSGTSTIVIFCCVMSCLKLPKIDARV